jgi:hypothetical protein
MARAQRPATRRSGAPGDEVGGARVGGICCTAARARGRRVRVRRGAHLSARMWSARCVRPPRSRVFPPSRRPHRARSRGRREQPPYVIETCWPATCTAPDAASRLGRDPYVLPYQVMNCIASVRAIESSKSNRSAPLGRRSRWTNKRAVFTVFSHSEILFQGLQLRIQLG